MAIVHSENPPGNRKGDDSIYLDGSITDCFAASIEYLENGLWPIVISPIDAKTPAPGKKPIGNGWGLNRPDEAFLRATFRRYPKANVGLLLGESGGIVDLDVDQPEHAGPTLAELFPGGLPNTFGWTNTGGRFHLLFLYDPRLAEYKRSIFKGVVGPDGEVAGNVNYCGLELRLGAAAGEKKQIQTVVPPSLLANGARRKWNGQMAILPLPESVYEHLDRHAVDKPKEPIQVAPRRPTSIGGSLHERYARSGFDKALDALEKVGEGGRNNALNIAGCAIGSLISWGFFSRAEAEQALLGSAIRIGLTQTEAKPTIKSGLDKGESEPRDPSVVGRNGTQSRSAKGVGRNGSANGHHSDNGPWEGGGSPPPGAGEIKTADGQPAERKPVEIDTRRDLALANTLQELRAEKDLFQRGNILVRIARHEDDTAKLDGGVVIRQAAGGVRVLQVTESVLSCYLTRVCDFYSWRATKSGEDVAVPVHPPNWLTKAVLEGGVYPGVRPLVSLAECPFPRSDGSLVTEPGYDPQTGVYLASTLDLGHMPDAPSRDDARAAAVRLFAPFKQFPFRADADRAVHLALILTMIARPGIAGPVPGVAVVGNRPGCGKGRAIDGAAVIAYGRPAPTTAYPSDEAEAVKLRVALALSAAPVVNLDNIAEGQFYGSSTLDSSLTSCSVSDRILGVSKTTEALVLRPVWIVNGNGISAGRDASRRWIVMNLATGLERPEERDDLEHPELLSYILDRRADFVRDALIIFRAHAAAGRPNGGWPPLGSFEEWDRIIRGATWFATDLDCNTTRRQAAEESPERLDRLALLEAWREAQDGREGGKGMTAEEAIKEATERSEALAAALAKFSRDGKPPAARVVGNVLRAIAGRNISGLAFQANGHYRRSVLWKVVSTDTNYLNYQKSDLITELACESERSVQSLSNPHASVDRINYDVNALESERKALRERSKVDCTDHSDSQPELLVSRNADGWVEHDL